MSYIGPIIHLWATSCKVSEIEQMRKESNVLYSILDIWQRYEMRRKILCTLFKYMFELKVKPTESN